MQKEESTKTQSLEKTLMERIEEANKEKIKELFPNSKVVPTHTQTEWDE